MRSSVDCTTNTSEPEFSVHTGLRPISATEFRGEPTKSNKWLTQRLKNTGFVFSEHKDGNGFYGIWY